MLATKEPEVSPKVEARVTWLLLLYGMTGFSGLLAEQALEKYVTLLVGATASASAVIIFTYFLGFAVGGLAAAGLLKRGLVRNPLRAYAGIELLTGFACIVFSFGFHGAMAALAPMQNLVAGEFGKYLVRFFCGCILVLPIAALMGASFPLLAQALDDVDADGPKRWSVAYSANLAGAALASIAAPLLLLPAIGLRGAMWLCLAICAAVAMFVQARPAREAPAHPRTTVDRGREWRSEWSYLLMASFLSGAVFFALEIIWTHLIGAVVGGSVYAFSWMLTGVLVGLLAGSWLVNRSKGMPVAKVFQLCAFTLLIQLSAWQFTPWLFVIAPAWIYKGFYTRELYRLLVACLLIVPAACSLGLIYPTLLKNPRTRPEDSAWFAGYLSAANSVGCLAGALLSSFVLVNRLGSELSLKLITLILGALWLFFYFREPNGGFRSRLVTVTMTVMLVWGATAKHWDWRYITSGASMYFGEANFGEASKAAAPATGAASPAEVVRSSIVFRDESIQGGFTTVVDTSVDSGASHKTVRSMYTNGKLQGNDDETGVVQGQQLGTAVLPSLFTKHFNKALLIGLGSGHTAAFLKQLGFERLDIAELSPGIVRAAEATFREANHGVLEDPTVHLALEDGRNLLLTSADTRYDLITVGLTTIWFSGATNLYSREFYQLARRHLAADGVLQQWVQLHRIGPDEIGSAIATVRSVFPYVSYWSYEGAGMVTAANHPLEPQAGRREYLASRLNQYGGLPLKGAQDVVDQILRGRLLSERAVDRLIRERHPVINTDHNRHIEYATPRYSSSERDWASYNVEFLKQWEAKAPARSMRHGVNDVVHAQPNP